MTEEQRLSKNKSIREALLRTKERRKSQICRTYECKIQTNKLTIKQATQLKMMFVEAKWIYNDILAWTRESEDNLPWNYVIPKAVKHYDENGDLVETELKYIQSQMKQEVQTKICSAIKGLSALKKHGYKVGCLKFISDYKQIHIKQISNTNIKKSDKYIKIPGIKGKVRVNGLSQFTHISGIEVACIDLLKRPNGYYLKICTFQDKSNIIKEEKIQETIGLDFGCSNTITTSKGDKYKVEVGETDRLKILQRRLKHKVGYKKGETKSNNFKRLVFKIRKEYAHISNIKKDVANKLVHDITKYETVVMQDEQISKWHKDKRFSKTVQHSILGIVKTKLMQKDNVVVLNKFCPTTKLCSACGEKMDMSLNDRTFKCKNCGYEEDRDIHAAKNMIWMYENNVGVGRTKLTRAELEKQIELAIDQIS